MFKLFKKETNRELEEIVEVLKLNASNNYRDATIDNLNDLENKYNELILRGKLSDSQLKHYEELIANYKEEFKNFTHKAQKAGW